ncbi:fumarylacetoacetate hydrolase family protein [Methanohalobium sp.]|uniref:fumarylacetoacetate hydrolase family protein n=1 Tax=Methanohalobium sp. TaxID=2837493 RepID=UPI0025F5561B|nr:fumarylacetoacetate hydrolase family protein [Methanohalobium sp.]
MFGRFKYKNEVFYGDVGKEYVTGRGECDGLIFKLSDIEVLPPVNPSKIICVGLNYQDHANELGLDIPDKPIIFLKPSSSIIGNCDKIVHPKTSNHIEYEAELGVFIGKKCKHIKADNANNVIAGYTCFNDVTARDLQKQDRQWTRAKSFDTFAPVGPFIATADEINPHNANIKCRLNGKTCQNSNTSNLIFDIPHLIEFISDIMTLQPGDVIATGTPPGVGKIHSGDIVEIEIEGIGTLSNEVVK